MYIVCGVKFIRIDGTGCEQKMKSATKNQMYVMEIFYFFHQKQINMRMTHIYCGISIQRHFTWGCLRQNDVYNTKEENFMEYSITAEELQEMLNLMANGYICEKLEASETLYFYFCKAEDVKCFEFVKC